MGHKVSVIIPVYNEGESIHKVISQVRTSAVGVDYEIIVVDGGSTDHTLEEVKRSGVNWMVASKKGRAAQMNEAARTATGSIFFFLHADTYPPPGFLCRAVNEIDSGFDAGCFRLRFDTDNWFLRANAWFTRFNVNAVRFGDQGLFVIREVFEKTGGFRNDHIVLEDQEMVRRLRRFGARFTVVPCYMTTSARKYLLNGPLKLQCTFFLVWLNYYFGKPQHELIRLYKARIKDSKITTADAKEARQTFNDLREEPGARESENTLGQRPG